MPAPKPPLDTSSPLQHWQQSGEHESLTKRLGFGGVPAKVFDDAREKADPGVDSPRRRVEERRVAAAALLEDEVSDEEDDPVLTSMLRRVRKMLVMPSIGGSEGGRSMTRSTHHRRSTWYHCHRCC